VVQIHSPRPLPLGPATYGIKEGQRAPGAQELCLPIVRAHAGRGIRQVTVLPSAKQPTRWVLQRVGPGETAVVARLRISWKLLLKGFCFCLLGTAQSGAEKSKCLPSRLTTPSRSRRQGRGVCVHWSEAKALDGRSARPRRRLLLGRADREANND